MRRDQEELMNFNNSGSNLFEILIREFYQHQVKEGDIVADCGANMGHHTVPLAQTVGPSGMVHAFEPIPVFADRLEEMRLELPIQLHRVALSDLPGTASFQHVENITGLSGLIARPLNNEAIIKTIEVSVSTLDIELADVDRLAFAKIDVECAEYALIVGAAEVMRKFQPALVFENGFDKTAEIAGFTKDQWFDVFSTRNYVPFDLYGHEITPSRWPDYCQPYNTFAVPEGGGAEAFLRGEWSSKIVDEVIARVRSSELTWP